MDKKPSRRVVNYADREITPAFVLQRIGRHALERAQEQPRDRQENLVLAQLMCALSLEAVLNHVGRHLWVLNGRDPCRWDEVERLQPKDKLRAVAGAAGLEYDPGSRPYQEIGPIFDFRDRLVHAKSDRKVVATVPDKAIDDDGYLLEHLVPGLHADWELALSLENAVLWRGCIEQITSALCGAADCPNCLIAGFSSGMSSTGVPVEGEG